MSFSNPPYDAAAPLFTDSKGRPIEAPDFGGNPIADTHAHLDMLGDPVSALANAARAGIGLIATVADVTEDAARTYTELETWLEGAAELLAEATGEGGEPSGRTSSQAGEPRSGEGPRRGTSAEGSPDSAVAVPRVRIIVGCHPHNAKLFDAAAEAELRRLAADPRTCALGELGLDYHYDQSPRDVQRAAFGRHLEIAHELDLPVVVHLREAHGDGERILRDVGVPTAGCILHCFNLAACDMQPFIELGCHVSFAGPVTFKKADEVREAAALVPADRILTETDCPFMAPEPFRGRTNEPAFTVFTAARIAGARGVALADFAASSYANALALLDRERSS